MAKHLTARNIAEDFGETSRHWTKLAAAGLVPGAFQPRDKATWLFDVDRFRAWHEAGQPEIPKPPVVVKKPEPAKRPDPEEKRKRKRAEIDAGIESLVRSALKPK